MDTPVKPYSLGKAVAVGLSLAAAFSLLSLFFLFMQARGTQVRLSGEVIAVTADEVTIRNARGADTVLTFAVDAKLRGVASVSAIVEGQHVMIRGKFSDAGVFEVDGLRVVKDLDQQ